MHGHLNERTSSRFLMEMLGQAIKVLRQVTFFTELTFEWLGVYSRALGMEIAHPNQNITQDLTDTV